MCKETLLNLGFSSKGQRLLAYTHTPGGCRQRNRLGEFRTIVDLQAAINRCIGGHHRAAPTVARGLNRLDSFIEGWELRSANVRLP